MAQKTCIRCVAMAPWKESPPSLQISALCITLVAIYTYDPESSCKYVLRKPVAEKWIVGDGTQADWFCCVIFSAAHNRHHGQPLARHMHRHRRRHGRLVAWHRHRHRRRHVYRISMGMPVLADAAAYGLTQRMLHIPSTCLYTCPYTRPHTCLYARLHVCTHGCTHG